MQSLSTLFFAYLQMYRSRIKWVLLFFVIFYILFWICDKMGYAKQYRSKYVKATLAGFLSLGCAFVFVATLFGRGVNDEYTVNLIPLASYCIAFVDGNIEMLLQIIMNIVMYVPLGFFIPCYFQHVTSKKYTICILLMCSFLIETIQGIAKIGYFELDDIINNVFGGVVGLIVYNLSLAIKEKVEEKRGEKPLKG